MPLIQIPCLTFHGDAGFPKGARRCLVSTRVFHENGQSLYQCRESSFAKYGQRRTVIFSCLVDVVSDLFAIFRRWPSCATFIATRFSNFLSRRAFPVRARRG